MNRAELKAAAKSQIKGNIGILFLITLVAVLIEGACSCIPVVGSLADVIILAPAFSLAIYCIYLNMANGVAPKLADLFGKFNQFWGSFKVMFLTGLFTMLWSMLFVIPGIIKGFSYSMAMFIYAENPEIGAREAINRSKAMMNGHKMELFVLNLSFIGWHLLGTITLGIAYIWIVPYIQATTINFYNKLKNAA